MSSIVVPIGAMGLAEAQHTLGLLYHEGEGVPQDRVAGHMWLSLAAARHASRYLRRGARCN